MGSEGARWGGQSRVGEAVQPATDGSSMDDVWLGGAG